MTEPPASARGELLSAKGTRLNRRGLETREALLEVAVRCLALGGPESVSANLVAREAGVTWGTVQHQFGDSDGLWAAMLDWISRRAGVLVAIPPDVVTLADLVEAVVDQIWHALDRPPLQAIHHLRSALPRELPELEADFPRTAAALIDWDARWARACRDAFAGFDVDRVKLRRVRSMLPGVVRGLHGEQHSTSYADLDEARRGLADAITAYLS